VAELSAAQAARKPWTQPLAPTVREPTEERLAPERRPRISGMGGSYCWVLLLNMIFYRVKLIYIHKLMYIYRNI
jgi:hypothetical protein